MIDISKLFIDVSTLPQNGYGSFQLAFLFAVYGYVLMVASDMISNGSEFLLLIPAYAGIVGSVVLPILGAVPDGMLVLFSGMGENAQSQLSVGVGALAGSTIMLLTIPWCLSVIGGRVDLDDQGRPNYRKSPKLSPENVASLSATGAAISPHVQTGGWIMIGTSVTYLFLQGPGIFYAGRSTHDIAVEESTWALIGMFLCFILFAAYLWYQIKTSNDDAVGSQQDRRIRVMEEAIRRGEVTLLGVMQAEFKTASMKRHLDENSPLVDNPELMARLKGVLKPFYLKYDTNNDGSLSMVELSSVFRDMGEFLDQENLKKIFNVFDSDQSGGVDFHEFVLGTAQYIKMNRKRCLFNKTHRGMSVLGYDNRALLDEEAGDAEKEEDEEDDMPEDLRHLSPEDQQKRLKYRALYFLGLGTLLVILFSDPMVDVLDEIGTRTGMGSFPVAFVLAPLASNASELVASYKYSLKKSSHSIAISLSTLQGAACMNNTFGLGIFMVLIYSKTLAWEYLAETLSILFVQIVMGFMTLKQTHTVGDSFWILALYPLSLLMVIALEAMGWD
mmetsp:Transcript_8561/g.12782  ORF Transcript_8561/g.12782 Transcript_8561/m.12782 type:complete len:558 (-) Transcript_8561:146-1819(-)|eukprot:CAMPEP_0185040244 /NCGR_PEP_ID=MMETSP1103-20130426/38062_1 /TAXON_ID=36769 /ORGANISM="Paraphysomonas bandaiensis, Strain Caron Lab Isolate" /LENGTH=557 /DNA_ID=CAMNT_0027579457 /DNA_START=99 /DNA_END=1772 /DNA_ORIENTATION=+